MLRRLLLVTGIATLAVTVVLASSAVAIPPDRQPIQLPDRIPLPAGVFCPWEGVATIPVNNETVTTFYDKDGDVARVMTTGSLRVTIKNLETGESMTFNIPGSTVTVDDLVTYRGRNIIFPVQGEMNLVSGRVVVTLDSEGFQHPVVVHGMTTDICDVLG